VIDTIITIQGREVLNIDELRRQFLLLKDGRHHIQSTDLRRRSLPMNDYYFAVVVPMVHEGLYEAGWDEIRTNAAAHEYLKSNFIRREIINVKTGEMMEVKGGSTARFTIPEFNAYVEEICKWAAEYLGVVIPSPDKAWKAVKAKQQKQMRGV